MTAKIDQANYARYVAEGKNEYLMGHVLPSGLPSSVHYDIKLITYHVLYWTGKEPWMVTPGRGHSYNVILSRGAPKLTARITAYDDHREGVTGIK